MTEPTIVCPKCQAEIRLTESLAAPLLESTRRQYEEKLAQKDEQVAEREASILQRENALAKAKASLDEQVAQALREERPKIAAEEAAKVRLALEVDLDAKAQEVADLQEIVKQRDERLLEAQKAQAQLVQDRRRLEDEKRELETTIDERLREEREKIAAEAAKKARLALEQDLAERSQEIADLQEVLRKRDEKLAEAQKAQAELLRQQRELDAAKRELELTVEKRVQEGLTATREQAKKEAEEELRLKVMEKEQTIASMQKTIEDLRRKAEQGSQQLQGEVQELALEEMLRSKFPDDVIAPVPKGEHGGDVKHEVIGPRGQLCGIILWESKRTKNWSDGWLSKLRDDQRAAKADIAIMVSQALPKGLDAFEQIDGVWVAHPKMALPMACCLRQALVDLHAARQSAEGQMTKAEMVYQYLTGQRFRHRVEAIVEAFSSMQEDLGKEKKLMMKQWAKREEQILRVVEATVGMYGDLQGIAGKKLQEVQGLELPALEEKATV